MNTDPAVEEKVRGLLAGAQTMHLSTSSDGIPWGAGTFFAESDPFTLTLVLEETGRTLANIKANPTVAVVVSTSSPFEPFLQGQATAVVQDDDEAKARARELLLAKAPQSAPFLDAPIVPLTLKVAMWRVTDVVNGWLPGKELPAPDTDIRTDGAAATETTPAAL